MSLFDSGNDAPPGDPNQEGLSRQQQYVIKMTGKIVKALSDLDTERKCFKAGDTVSKIDDTFMVYLVESIKEDTVKLTTTVRVRRGQTLPKKPMGECSRDQLYKVPPMGSPSYLKEEALTHVFRALKQYEQTTEPLDA